MFNEDIQWIQGTPFGINIRSIEFIPPHIHEDVLEIIFCLKGTLRFLYAFEYFDLSEGEFISVDKDMHYLSGDNDNICVSFYINLEWFKAKYPYINSLSFICEATKSTQSLYPTENHETLKGILIATLLYMSNPNNSGDNYRKTIISLAEKIITMFIRHFDIVFYYKPHLKIKKDLFDRYHSIMLYLNTHSNEKILLKDISEKYHLTTAYISEFFRTITIGFRQYLGYIRAVKSEKLLVENKMSIITISEYCGYSDPKYYYRAFYKWHKCTPAQFQKSYGTKVREECRIQELDIGKLHVFLTEMMREHYINIFLY